MAFCIVVDEWLGVLFLVTFGIATRLHTMPYVAFQSFGAKLLLPVLYENGTLGELRLWLVVPIRTGLGTRLNRLDSSFSGCD